MANLPRMDNSPMRIIIKLNVKKLNVPYLMKSQPFLG